MKKNKSKIAFLGLIAFALALNAQASTVDLSLSETTVKEGKTFTVNISLDPQTTKNYTAKIALAFPPEFFEVSSFSFGGSWMPLTQSGYDLLDNGEGVMIKTGGFPGGFLAKTSFGAVTFKVKKAGTGSIALDAARSEILDGENANKLTNAPTLAVTITKAAAASSLPAKTNQVRQSESPAQNTNTGEPAEIVPSNEIAAVVASLPSESREDITPWVYAVLGTVIGLVAGCFAGVRRKEKIQ